MTAQVREVRAGLPGARTGYRAVMVHVQPESSARPRLASAVALARALDAKLIGVGAEMISSIDVRDSVGIVDDQWLVELRLQIETNLRQAEEMFRKSSAGVETEWIALHEIPATAIARLSREADLIVAGGSPSTGQNSHRWCDPAQLVLLAGRPVLVAPSSGGQLAAEAVIVAWKDTREARRATADALPFLRSARDVVVMEVCEEWEFGEAQTRTFGVVQGLQRHGVDARAKVEIAPPERVGEELNLAAAAISADLIVAGGYGHSRLGEWVFGGVTRDLLRDPERFLLLSH